MIDATVTSGARRSRGTRDLVAASWTDAAEMVNQIDAAQ
jgi:hypothetical protein